MQQGQEAGALARQLYPGGILVGRHTGKTPPEITLALIVDGTTEILLEALILAALFVA
jgi:hypothetical protein